MFLFQKHDLIRMERPIEQKRCIDIEIKPGNKIFSLTFKSLFWHTVTKVLKKLFVPVTYFFLRLCETHNDLKLSVFFFFFFFYERYPGYRRNRSKNQFYRPPNN